VKNHPNSWFVHNNLHSKIMALNLLRPQIKN
jgi:hypothetical protein